VNGGLSCPSRLAMYFGSCTKVSKSTSYHSIFPNPKMISPFTTPALSHSLTFMKSHCSLQHWLLKDLHLFFVTWRYWFVHFVWDQWNSTVYSFFVRVLTEEITMTRQELHSEILFDFEKPSNQEIAFNVLKTELLNFSRFSYKCGSNSHFCQ